MSHKSFKQFFLEDAAMYQSIAMPSIGFGQKDFGRNPRKSITGGTFDVTGIGSMTMENEEEKKHDRKKSCNNKNKNNRINRRNIRRHR